jgi:hypothetical protein
MFLICRYFPLQSRPFRGYAQVPAFLPMLQTPLKLTFRNQEGQRLLLNFRDMLENPPRQLLFY